jgi:hypothetical protein
MFLRLTTEAMNTCIRPAKAEFRFTTGNSSQKITLAPEVGFEPTTNRLTADRSTTELLWIVFGALYLAHVPSTGK